MERTATAGPSGPPAPSGGPLPPDAVVDDGADRGADAVVAGVPAEVPRAPAGMPQQRARDTVPGGVRAEPARPARPAAGLRGLRGPHGPRPWRLLPTPPGTPFTFGYAALLAVTSLVARYADPAVVDALRQSSSTDVAHLVRAPLLVLPASALWIAGGVVSAYSLCFLLVLTALERRIGGLRTAGVFLFGHVLATLATEVPIGLAVLTGRLPDSAAHRLDYGISFGVAASLGALAGLLTPWLRWPLLTVFAGMLVQDLATFDDPMTSCGHLIAVGLGVATWPVMRRWRRARLAEAGAAPGTG
ncbi:rhomboid-like protein [Streptomyces sp. NPDC006706]|uniref:rhomboid-like protein n=1 Tax=Streptomyces sp. NPDC006706 TaxID=3364761 RepID=UPI0036A0ADA9